MPNEKQEEPWYKDGLRFRCTQCGDCCTGAPGYVWFNKVEGQQIADKLEIDVDTFYKKYARRIGIRYSLKEYANGDCIFFDNQTRACKVYDRRPNQCRTWPFWDSNLRTEQDWKNACEVCPGSGTGKLYSLEQVEVARKTVRV